VAEGPHRAHQAKLVARMWRVLHMRVRLKWVLRNFDVNTKQNSIN